MYSVPCGYSGKVATGRRKGGFLKIMALGQVLKMDRIYTDGNGDRGVQGRGNHRSKKARRQEPSGNDE